MIDFNERRNRRKKEQDEAIAWENDLRERAKSDHESLSPGDVEALLDLNESFKGDYIDKDAERKYYNLKMLATEFLSACKYAQHVSFDEPEQTQMNASVYIDMPIAMAIQDKSMSLMAAMVNTADFMCISTNEEKETTRITFTVRDVWKKK